MYKINIFIISIFVLIFIAFINSQIYRADESFYMREPPHLLRRLGLAPRYCPYRSQYY